MWMDGLGCWWCYWNMVDAEPVELGAALDGG
jgi:hypothetical protein